MTLQEDGFNRLLLAHWRSVTEHLGNTSKIVVVDGHRLDLASVVSTAR